MRKRIYAVLLALALVFCFVPFAAAAETPYCFFHLENHLLNMNYWDMDTRTEIAVGDEIAVVYCDSVPAQVYVNGSKVCDLAAGDAGDSYVLPVTKTGTIDVAVKQGEKTLLSRTFRVIASADMYKKLLKNAFVPQMPALLSVDELKDAAGHGFPLFNPFLPFAYFAMLSVNFFMTLFSFIRIVR